MPTTTISLRVMTPGTPSPDDFGAGWEFGRAKSCVPCKPANKVFRASIPVPRALEFAPSPAARLKFPTMSRLYAVVCLFVAAVPSTGWSDAGEKVDDGVREFLKQYCIDCHGADEQEADFRVDLLQVSTTATNAESWQLVLDNLNLGEMPPEDQPQPELAEVERVTNWMVAELRRARRVLSGDRGEVVLRRLNRTEYEYTIEDLFGVRGDFTSGFPADATVEGFDNNGAGLMLSAEQIDAYLQAADDVLDRAIQTTPRPETKKAHFTLHDFNREAWKRFREGIARRQRDFETLTPNEQQRTREMIKDLEESPYSGFSFPSVENGKLRVPTPEDDEPVDAVIAIQAAYAAPDSRRAFSVKYPGWYRFRVTAYGINNQDQPVRLKISYGSLREGTIPKVAAVISLAESQPQDFEYRLYLQPKDVIKVEMIDGQNWARREDLIHLPGPFVAIRSMEMEGPILEQWPPRGHQRLLGRREADELKDEHVPTILAGLAPALFRRRVARDVIREYEEFYVAARNQGSTPLDAFRLTVKAMMVSPHFLYHVEPEDRPDDDAIANRLAYFLWRSMPDARLRQLAGDGKLTQPEVLRSEVDRLLADEKSLRFLKDFAGQWLEIDEVGEMQPDGDLYPEYESELERSMIGETEAFLRELIQRDLSLDNLIDSDWAMLNDRMARHYGIPGVQGSEFRRVRLDKEQTVRGGLLTHASILNVTSNGTTTSPVVRGVWILERLLGTPPPPPPPDVPPIEPDIRGVTRIQMQLERHRSIEQCAACHRKIDPYGLAMEGFDVIGGLRTKYRALIPTANPNRPKLTQGPRVIASDRLPRLGEFEDFREFRELLKQETALVHKNVAHQLATFALGTSMDYSDAEVLREVVEKTNEQGGGMKTMIRELVASEIFARK